MPASDQGTLTGRYTFIPRTLVFLTRGEKVLLLKGAPHKRLWAGLYNGLGGHVERGEDVLSAARRELREEAGLSPDSLWLCGVVAIDAGPDTGIGIYVLRGECLHGEPQPSPEGELAWVSWETLGELPLVEDLTTLLPRLRQPGDRPFSALYQYDNQGKLLIRFAE